MKSSRFTEEEIIGILRHEAGVPVPDLCRKHGISNASLYNWKVKYGGVDVSEARRVKALEDENGRLNKLLADAMLDNSALKDLLGKNGGARCRARCHRPSPDCVWNERAAGVLSVELLPDDDALSGASHRRCHTARGDGGHSP